MGDGIKLPVINGLGRTNRVDNWWSQPLAMGIALTLALLYTFWRLFLHDTGISYELDGSTVMSPIFSPNVLEWDFVWVVGLGPSSLGKRSNSGTMDTVWV